MAEKISSPITPREASDLKKNFPTAIRPPGRSAFFELPLYRIADISTRWYTYLLRSHIVNSLLMYVLMIIPFFRLPREFLSARIQFFIKGSIHFGHMINDIVSQATLQLISYNQIALDADYASDGVVANAFVRRIYYCGRKSIFVD